MCILVKESPQQSEPQTNKTQFDSGSSQAKVRDMLMKTCIKLFTIFDVLQLYDNA